MSMYLTNGASSQRGIYLVGRSNSCVYASYAYRENGSLKCEIGPQEKIKALFIEHQKSGQSDNAGCGKVALFAIVPIALIAIAAVFAQNSFQIAGVAAFALFSAFPCYALSLIGENNYSIDALHQQFRRNHGAEHTLMDYFRKEGERAQTPIKPKDLQGYRYLDRECGTVLMASVVLWSAAIGAAIAFTPSSGVLGAFLLIAVVTIMLLLNIYANPANPLMYIQKSEVAPPTLAELEIAATAYNTLLTAFANEEL